MVNYLEDQELLDDVDAGVAGGGVLEAVLVGDGEGEAHEDCDGEERVDVHEAVESRDMDARGAAATGASAVLWVVVLRVRVRSAGGDMNHRID